MKEFTNHVVGEEHAGLTVEEYIKGVLRYSGRRVQKLTRQKGILLNGKPAFLQKKVKPKDALGVLRESDADFGVRPEPGTVDILYEDGHLMVLDKPAFQLVHPAGRTSGGTLANFLAHEIERRGLTAAIRPVHRLDRDTSGCVIFAKSARSQALLEEQLKSGDIKRIYLALVKGTVEPPSGTVDAPIGPHPRLPNRRAAAVNGRGERAVTHYRTVSRFSDASLLELSLDTGRTHQIRVHLAHIGYPILGDGMYGVRTPLIGRQALHAVSVGFARLDDARRVTVESPLPDDMSKALECCERKGGCSQNE